jgi:hypothetical protein
MDSNTGSNHLLDVLLDGATGVLCPFGDRGS